MADTAVMSISRAGTGSSAKRVMISPGAGHVSAPGSRPSTRGRSTASERLTPMPDYLKPVVRSAVNRWKKLHEDHMMEKLVVKRADKKVRKDLCTILSAQFTVRTGISMRACLQYNKIKGHLQHNLTCPACRRRLS